MPAISPRDRAIWEATDIGLIVLGRWIKGQRLMLHLTQAELAFRARLHQSTISRLETGTLRSLRIIRLAEVIAGLNGAHAAMLARADLENEFEDELI
jgi:transcriptional regulator with XRE-family HTH domain